MVIIIPNARRLRPSMQWKVLVFGAEIEPQYDNHVTFKLCGRVKEGLSTVIKPVSPGSTNEQISLGQ